MQTKRLLLFVALLAMMLSLTVAPAHAEVKPIEVLTGVRLMNVEKVDLSANTYKLDFYIWFSWNPGEITLKQIQDFEFLNGAPTKDVVFVTEAEGFVQYRVRGDFVKTFDFTRYPFESHDLVVTIEHKNMNSTALMYVTDPDSTLDAGVSVVGWDLLSFTTGVAVHKFSGNSMSNFLFDLQVGRPVISSLVKNVLPISVIVVISLLTFFINPKNFGQRIGLAVSTLMAASALHLSLLSPLPPTGYLTLADRMMLIVYIIFLFNLASSVYIMRMVDQNRVKEAENFNGFAARALGVIAIVMIGVQFLF